MASTRVRNTCLRQFGRSLLYYGNIGEDGSKFPEHIVQATIFHQYALLHCAAAFCGRCSRKRAAFTFSSCTTLRKSSTSSRSPATSSVVDDAPVAVTDSSEMDLSEMSDRCPMANAVRRDREGRGSDKRFAVTNGALHLDSQGGSVEDSLIFCALKRGTGACGCATARESEMVVRCDEKASWSRLVTDLVSDHSWRALDGFSAENEAPFHECW